MLELLVRFLDEFAITEFALFHCNGTEQIQFELRPHKKRTRNEMVLYLALQRSGFGLA